MFVCQNGCYASLTHWQQGALRRLDTIDACAKRIGFESLRLKLGSCLFRIFTNMPWLSDVPAMENATWKHMWYGSQEWFGATGCWVGPSC